MPGTAAVLLFLLAPQIVPALQTQPVPGVTYVRAEGTVQDSLGRPVAGAVVHLRGKGVSNLLTVATDASGKFLLSGPVQGDLAVLAERQGLITTEVHLELSEGGVCSGIVLVLGGAPGDSRGCINSDLREMQFSDAPNFSIAAVTDWTAAGGHGSDSILRTSESLTRDTVKLSGASSESASPVNSHEGYSRLEPEYREALKARPDDFDANYKLGSLLVREGRLSEALPLLEAAHRKQQDDFAAEFALATALKDAGRLAEAKEHVDRLILRRRSGGLLRTQGELQEAMGDPLSAVRAFEEAVREDPSEENYFKWGSELLIHRAIWQAKDVFTAAVKRFPKSTRLVTALGTSLFACALYEDAAMRLCEAADLAPRSVEPYEFLGKAVLASPKPLACAAPKLAEFAGREPGNPQAKYLYAMALWKQQGSADARVEELLEEALSLDPKCGDAYLQMGNLMMARHNVNGAIENYQKAIGVNPQLSEAHYKLGMAFDRIGEREKAKREFQIHEGLEAAQKEAVEQQRREVKQFLVLQDNSPGAKP